MTQLNIRKYKTPLRYSWNGLVYIMLDVGDLWCDIIIIIMYFFKQHIILQSHRTGLYLNNGIFVQPGLVAYIYGDYYDLGFGVALLDWKMMKYFSKRHSLLCMTCWLDLSTGTVGRGVSH